MKLRSKNKFSPEVSTSSFSDIMFFLMLFFLIASTMISPGVIKLTLPNAKHHQSVNKMEVAVSITKDLKYFVNNEEIASIEGLEKSLLALGKNPENITVVIRCDKDVPVQDLVNVMQIGNKLKMKMILATQSPKV